MASSSLLVVELRAGRPLADQGPLHPLCRKAKPPAIRSVGKSEGRIITPLTGITRSDGSPHSWRGVKCLGPLYPIKSPCQLAPPHKLRGSHLPQHGQQPLGDSRGPAKSFQKRCLHQSLGELSYQKGLFLGDLTTINTPCPIKAKVLNSHLTNLSFSL